MRQPASTEKQNEAIERANLALLSVGLPLYGDVADLLARIVSIVDAPGSASIGGRSALREAIAAANSLYPAFPMFDPAAPQPHQLVNRAFSAMPYGGSVGFQNISEADTRAEACAKIAGNLTKLGELLRDVGKVNDARDVELNQHRTAILGIATAFDLIERQRRTSKPE